MKIKSIYSTLFGSKDEYRLGIDRAIRFSFILKEKIDNKKLQRAMDKALVICPYIAYNVICEQEVCYYTDNDLPLELHDKFPRVLGGDDNNGHLIYIRAKGMQIDIYCSHALTDGCGIFWFAEALFHYYFDLSGEPLYHGAGKPDYFADLMEKDLEVPKDHVFTDYNPEAFFRIPEAGALKDMKSMIYAEELQIKTFDCVSAREEFDDFCTMYKCSHSVALFYFLARAVRSVHPEAGNISCRMPVNARKILGVENAFQNCSLNQVIMSYPARGLAEGSETEEIAAIKVHMKQQLAPGHIAFCLNQFAAYMKKEGNCDHFPELLRGMDQSCMITDLGEVFSRDIADKISSVTGWSTFTGVPLTIMLGTIGNRVVMEISQVFESGVYLEALERVMASYGIGFKKTKSGRESD